MSKTLVVMLPIANNLKLPMLEEILRVIRQEVAQYDLTLRFLLTVNDTPATGADPKTLITELSKRCPDVTIYVVPGAVGAITDAGGGRYVFGFYEASKMGDFVIDIDSAGAHDPLLIGQHIKALLAGKDAVFSTRFGRPGAKDLYPWQRQLASRGVTVLSNLILGAGVWYPDMASGYQGFSSEVLREIFAKQPPETWITLKTTTAFIETELRSYVVWYLLCQKKPLNQCIAVQPIVYGVMKKGVNFPAQVGYKALEAFVQLAKRKKEYLRKCRE